MVIVFFSSFNFLARPKKRYLWKFFDNSRQLQIFFHVQAKSEDGLLRWRRCSTIHCQAIIYTNDTGQIVADGLYTII